MQKGSRLPHPAIFISDENVFAHLCIMQTSCCEVAQRIIKRLSGMQISLFLLALELFAQFLQAARNFATNTFYATGNLFAKAFCTA